MRTRRKRPNPRLVKIHRNYTVQEISRLFDLHKNTVLHWINKDGLPTIDRTRPLLVFGAELRRFLEKRRANAKRPCEPGQLYCMKCKGPTSPAHDIADYLPISPTSGNLCGICPNCASLMYRRVSFAKLAQVQGALEVTMRGSAPTHKREPESLRGL